MSSEISLVTKQGTYFTFPFTSNNREICELYEHDGYPEWKKQLYQDVLPSFKTLIDLTPRFGFFSISAVLLVPNLSIWLTSTSSALAPYLEKNLQYNQIFNHFAINPETTLSDIDENMTNLDEVIIRATSAPDMINFIRCDGPSEKRPALLLECDAIDDFNDVCKQLNDMDYHLYSLCPLTNKLLCLSESQITQQESYVIFGFTEAQIQRLDIPTPVIIEPSLEIAPLYWKTMLFKLPYANACFHEWEANKEINTDYTQILNQVLFALADTDEDNRINLMLSSFYQLQAMPIENLTFPQLLTAARVCYELGLKHQNQLYLSQLISIFQTVELLDLSEPFLPPLAHYTEHNTEADTENDSQDDIIPWCLSVILEAYELNRSDSCYRISSNDVELLTYYLKFPYPNKQLAQRLAVYQAVNEPSD